MEKILTAMGTERLINELKNIKDFLVYEKDIPYREGIIELLKQEDKFNIIIINEDLPGQLNFGDLIKNIKLINKKINIIFFLENKNNILEKSLSSENIKIFYKDNFNWNEFILYIKNINKKLNKKKNIILNKKINNEENMEFNSGKINYKEKTKLYDRNNIKNNVENKNLINKNEIKNIQNKYLINNEQKEINNFNKENKLNNEKIKNNKLNLKYKEKNNINNNKLEINKNKKGNKITIISEIEKNKINIIINKYIKNLNSIDKIYFIKFNKINKNIKYSEKIILIATTEFEDVKKINNSIINIQNKYNIKSEKINILFVKKKIHSINIVLLKNLFKKYKILRKINLKKKLIK